MPTLTKEPVQKANRPLFIGLQSYTEAQSAIFYGRDEEINRLTNLVKANTLTIVFGKSGTGKTSLLNAGVFPRLRKDYCLPFRIRLEFQDDSPDLVTQIKNILKSEIDKYGFKVETYPSAETTLWEYFHREQLWKSVTPILIFDQFEEIFTLGKKSHRFGTKELAAFWEELADLIENSIPEKLKEKFLNEIENIGYSYKVQKIKTLFSFREEFLPEFESITAKIPSIKYSRFRLLPMNGAQAYEVITRTWKDNINGAQAHNIVGFFTNEEDKNRSYDVMEIEPSLLSQVCSFIDKERIRQGRDTISPEFLSNYPKEIILRSIYNEVLGESNAAVMGNTNGNPNGLPTTAKPVNEFVEDKLITDEGYRSKYALTEQDEKIKPGIEVLKTKYFVRDDGKSIELTHDVLTPLIKRDREDRRKGWAMAVAKKKANKRALRIILLALLIGAAAWFFAAREAKQSLDQSKRLQTQIEIDKQSLIVLKRNIDIQDSLLKLKNALRVIRRDDVDTLPYANLLKQSQDDSILLESLKKENRALVAEKSVLDSSLRSHKEQLENFTRMLNTSSNEAKRRLLIYKGESPVIAAG